MTESIVGGEATLGDLYMCSLQMQLLVSVSDPPEFPNDALLYHRLEWNDK